MSKCCDQLAFVWEPDGDEQALVCSGCGACWTPQGESTEDTADLKEAWQSLRERLTEKKTWGQAALKDLMLDVLLASARKEG